MIKKILIFVWIISTAVMLIAFSNVKLETHNLDIENPLDINCEHEYVEVIKKIEGTTDYLQKITVCKKCKGGEITGYITKDGKELKEIIKNTQEEPV